MLPLVETGVPNLYQGFYESPVRTRDVYCSKKKQPPGSSCVREETRNGHVPFRYGRCGWISAVSAEVVNTARNWSRGLLQAPVERRIIQKYAYDIVV